MIQIDFFWIFGWFIVGLVVFQIRGIKHTFTAISSLFSLLSLFLLIPEPNPIAAFMNFIGLDFISGLFTFLAYLIGANISRYAQFGEMSPKIITYSLLFFLLWMVLETLF